MSTKDDLLTAKLNLKHIRESGYAMQDKDLETIAEKLADKMNKRSHVCPFNDETVASLKDLGYYFATAQKAFKGFIVLCIVIGAAAAFLIGLYVKGKEFWEQIFKVAK